MENGVPGLARLFAELTGTLLGDVGPTEVLALLTSRCPAMLRVDSVGGVVIDGGQMVITGSHETAKALMLCEMQIGHGPSWDCFSTGQALINVDLTTAADRWPIYAPRAVSAGITTSTALPLRARAELVGALYFCGRSEFAAVRVGQALADTVAAIVVTQRALASSERTANQLQAALTSRVVIEQAKGVVFERAGIDMAEAFTRLRAYARDNNLRLTDVAQAAIDGALDPGVWASLPPSPGD